MYKKKIYYDRKTLVKNLKIPDKISIGDTICFTGILYKDKELTKEIGYSQNLWTITNVSDLKKISYLSTREITIVNKSGLLGRGSMMVSSFGQVTNLVPNSNIMSLVTNAKAMITGGTDNYLGIIGTMENDSIDGKAVLTFYFKK